MYEFWYNQVKPKHGEKAKTMLHGKIKLLQSTQKQKTFTQILKKMMKQDVILQITNQKDNYQEEKIKKLLD